jgi:transposase-like protein
VEEIVPQKRRNYPPEYRAEAVKRVIESSLPAARVARELGILEGTLGNWVAAYRREHADEEPTISLDERARLHEVERELREVKMENEFLKKCASYFAQRQP